MKGNSSSRISRSQYASADHVVHFSDKYLTLVEDTFGMLFDAENKPIIVKRYTWTNHNKISIAVITFGARIISMKVPDRAANIEELVVGFDDLAGYLFYEKYGFGGTRGRTTTKIFKSTYVVDGKQYWLPPNDGEHHDHGGFRTFDKVNWTPYVKNSVLQLSYVSPDGDEGYPGDLQVRMTLELTRTAEFRMVIEANTSKITPVDICNLTYFNLAGHHAGEEELRKHEILINANCHTVMDANNEFPTGQMMNVVHTKFDFQTPKLLGEVMGPGPEADFDQNFCVNRGVHQGDGFVVRVVHPFKGRVLEIYSNQCGVNFSNGAEIPDGHIHIPSDLLSVRPSITSQEMREHEAIFIVISKIAQYFKEKMQLAPEQYHGFIRNLISKLIYDDSMLSASDSDASLTSELDLIDAMTGPVPEGPVQNFDMMMILKPLEVQFLLAIKELIPYVTEDMPFDVVKDVIDDILVKQAQAPTGDESDANKSNSFIHRIISNQLRTMRSTIGNEIPGEHVHMQQDSASHTSAFRHLKEAKEAKEQKMFHSGVAIPSIYKPDRITGRGGVVYKRYGAMCFRTQCYPSGLLMENFPTPILKPNETYRHTITYKFWILAGDPKKWLHRISLDNPCDDASYDI